MAITGGAGWLYSRRRRHRVMAVVDHRLPYQVAYDELARIQGLHLPGKGHFKEYYTLVTDCLRNYLERQFQVPASERTTTELKAVLRHSGLSPEQIRQLIDLFIEGDLVKFAKVTPELEEAEAFIEQGRKLIDLTRPLAAVEAGSVGEGAAAPSPKTMEISQ
jgi:hypothetical protein